MFGSLRKKLQEAIGKARDKIAKEPEAKEAEAREEAREEIKEEHAEPEQEEMPAADSVIAEELVPDIIAAEAPSETLEEEREEEEFVEKIERKKMKAAEAALEKPVEIPAAEKKGIRGLFAKVTEKELSESDIDAILAELNKALLASDVAFEVAERICGDVRSALLGRRVKRSEVEQSIANALRSAIRSALQQERVDLEERIKESRCFTIVLLGFNGVGKTTTLAKLAHKFKRYNPVIAAGDTFRAASIEQLEEHASRLSVRLVKHKYGSDSAAVIFDAVAHARASGSRLVLADTAGRSHSNVNLMDELRKVVRVNKPDMKLLVLDALAGNDIYDQARLFDEAVGVDAIVLAKADVYEKGGAALSAAYTIKKPILFLGTGQEYNDLVEFDADAIAENLLG